MSVSAETYIVISLMFAVFAAVAAVGTSVVLGAGFERLRTGFDLIKRQTGFFSDAIYKLDLRTQKLDEETAKLKAGVYGVYDRMDRVEKQTTFMADAVSSIEHRILNGTPAQPAPGEYHDRPRVEGMNPVHTVGRHAPVMSPQPKQHHAAFESLHNPVQEDSGSMMSGLFRDELPETSVTGQDEIPMDVMGEDHDSAGGLGTLISRYFQSENDKGIIYH